MRNFFSERKGKLDILKAFRNRKKAVTKEVPENLFIQCKQCHMSFLSEKVEEALYVCPDCGHHMRLMAITRMSMVLDKGYAFIHGELESSDPINFPGYQEKLDRNKASTGLSEAAVTAVGTVQGNPAVVCVLDSNFFMGSMGSIVGEKVTLAFEYAGKHKLPLIIFSASGGARMQEGIFSLMQMAKTSSAAAVFNEKGGLFISYLTHPTTGGVTASFASLGDIILAEPGALIGFAGPRVIEQTIKQTLPEGFQTAEFLLEHGFIDKIVKRQEMKKTLAILLKLHNRKGEFA